MRKILFGLAVMLAVVMPVYADTVTAKIGVACEKNSPEGPFEFNIEEVDNAPTPEMSELWLKRGQKRDFAIQVTEPGTYLYKINQSEGTDTRINYDDTVYKAFVFVESDDEGFLSDPAVIISKENSQIKEDYCSFENEWVEITDSDRDAANLVADMIDALPDPKDVTAADKNQVDLCKEAYDNLTDLQKSLIPEAKKKLDADEAAVVADIIFNLPYPVVTPDEMPDVEAVKSLYDQLSDEQKEMIKDAKEHLDLTEAAVVAAIINQLPYPATAEDLDDINKAKEYYDRLSDEQKEMIPDALNRQEECEASAVTDMIDHLPSPEDVTFDDREAILKAKEAFDELSPEQQEMNHEAKQKLDELLEALEQKDREVANDVAELINNLPDPEHATGDDLELVNIAKDAYDELTDYQKSLIQDAKDRLDDIEVAVVRDLINKLPNPEDTSSTDRPDVDKAKDAYNALSEDQKAQLIEEKEKIDHVDEAVTEAEDRGREAAQRVADLINALPDPDNATAADRQAIEEAKKAYESLTDEQKALIQDEKAKLDATDTVVSIDEKEGEEAARAVEELINALPGPEDATSKDRMAVDTAKAAYNKLSDAQKALIPEAKSRLDAIDAVVSECERIDAEAANAVAEMIRNLPDPNHAIAADRYAVDAAKEAYDQLTDYQKSLIQEEKSKLDDVDLAVVEDMIYNLPDPKDAGKEDKPAVDAARKAFDGLTEDQQKSIPEMKKKLEDVEVDVVQDMINRGHVPSTADDYDEIFATKEAYEKLNEEQKKKIKDVDKLYKQELDAVKDIIQRLPDPEDITLADKPDVQRARTAFNHLSDDQKAEMTNEKKKLEALEAMIRTFEEDENAEGDRVKSLIDALPESENIRVSDKDAVYKAKNAYKTLSDNQKNRITESKEKLDACEAALVKALIDALPDPITAADIDQIKEARDAFNELTQDQKGKIPDAEEILKQSEVELLKELINTLPDPNDASSSDRDVVNAINDLYDKLSDDQKEQLKDEKEKLDAIDRAVAEEERTDREASQSVADLIDALPDPQDAKASDRAAIDAAKEAYEQLTDYQKSLIEDKKAKMDAVEAMVKVAEQLNEDIVAELINNLPDPEDVTINDRATVDALKEAYDRLTDDQKELIADLKERLDEIDKAIKALEDEAHKHANTVKELIDDLPDLVKSKDLEKVKNAIEKYNALSDYEKSLIPEAKEKLDKAVAELFRDVIADIILDGKVNKDDLDLIQRLEDMSGILTEDQKKMLEEEKKQLDEMERECMTDIINSFPENPTEADWDAYVKAKEAFDRLSKEQKEQMQSQKEKLDAMGGAIVSDMINHLPELGDVTSLDRDSVEKAKEAYNSLSDEQKKKLAYEKARLDEIDAAVTLAEETDRRAVEAVATMIAELPNPEDATSADRSDVDAVRAAYNALTQIQKNMLAEEIAKLDAIDSAVEKAEKLDWKAVKEVIAMFNELPNPENVTEDDRDLIDKCYEAYNRLTKEQKAMIPDYKKRLDELDALVRLAEESGDARAVADMINALPNPENATSEDRAQVDAAKRAYDALTDEMKEKIIKEKSRLDAIDAAVAEAEKIDHEAASAVEAMINALPDPKNATSMDRQAVDAAKLAYNNLTPYQKSLIAKAKRLLDEIDLAVTAEANADLRAANAVAALIEKLPEPEDATANDRSAVNIARAAYEKLTDAQKALIPEYKKKLDAVDAAVRAAENKKNNNSGSNSGSSGSSSGNSSGSGSGSGSGSSSGSGSNSGSNSGNTQSSSSGNLNNVRTGDTNPIEIFVMVMIAAMAVVFVSGRRRKMEER